MECSEAESRQDRLQRKPEQWLQSTFANRFNRYRKANGHVFQGRYKAILLEGDAVGPVCHYIHLNPVRAGLVTACELEKYEASSFHQWWYPSKRWPFFDMSTALAESGGKGDTAKGRSSYRDYLVWLSEEDGEQKRIGFEKMCHGWVKGSQEFRNAVLVDLQDEVCQGVVEAEAGEMREPVWERQLRRGLDVLGKKDSDLIITDKGIDWKVALARYLRESSLPPNAWLAKRLNMGTAKSVSSRISTHRKIVGHTDKAWRKLKMLECVD